MRRLLSILFAGAVLSIPIASDAQAASDYPNRPVRLIVGFAPGGATDTLARLLTGVLKTEMGQTVYVENMPGASGYIAWKAVSGSEPDGYTLLLGENALAIRSGFKDQTPAFDPTTQLDAIASLAYSPLALIVANKVPANTIQELIALSQSSPTKLNFASAGSGAVSTLNWEVVRAGAKIAAVNVPYKGGGPAMADVIAGHVDIIMASTQVAKPLVENKMVKALAVTGKQRSPALPQLPTLTEAGITHFDVDLRFWFGIFAPKGLPGDVKAKLESALKSAMTSPAVRDQLTTLDITPDFAPGPALQARLSTEIKNWKAFIEANALTSQEAGR